MTSAVASGAAFALLNPVAGNCDPEKVAALLQTSLARYPGLAIYRTTGQEDLGQVVRDALIARPSLVVAAGGDGTVSVVADVLAGTEIPLAILPVGTGNLVARELGITSLEIAAQLLEAEGPVRRLDLMRAGDRHYVCHVSLGVYSKVVEDAPFDEKRRYGRWAYIRSLFRQVAEERAWPMEIEVDGRRIRTRASLVLAANVGETGLPPLRWGQNVAADDGVIDLCVVRGRTWISYLSLLAHALLGRHREDPQTDYYRARRLRMRAGGLLPVRADGETVGVSEIELEVVPAAVRVLAPPPEVATDDRPAPTV